MELRAHHLLCIQKFTGRGYHAAFTAHMTAVCAYLHNDPQTDVILRTECDDICAACPNMHGGHCSSADKVAAFDRAVLSVCRLREGDMQSWSVLRQISRTHILQTEQFDAICADCQWYALCKKTEVDDSDEKHENT